MELFPAIDLLGGQVVRLERGDYQKVTVYAADPLVPAAEFAAAGARYLHCVDLDGARDGTMVNADCVRRLTAESGLRVEIGGGIRSEKTIETYLECGIWRVILGTVAVRDPEFTGRMLARYGDRIAIGMDIRDGMVAVSGWLESGGIRFEDLCERLRDQGAKGLIVTDISRDGMLSGTHRALYGAMMQAYPTFELTASGGVSGLDDIRALREMGMYGAIIGKAYYEGRIDLKEAFEVAG
ncbi:MAG: 1-(5-phosphoribosyl)-5-[Clostridia bacterium]|nr:1-(5-phosphoribosyl)-5-[(5-phosphoribosylamino)methylideneamino]imidazole-4-carboxamide isomerase [Clostridia bacterium]